MIKKNLRKGYGIISISPNLEFKNLENKWIAKASDRIPIEIYIVNKGTKILNITLTVILLGGCYIQTPDGEEKSMSCDYLFVKDPEKIIKARLKPN